MNKEALKEAMKPQTLHEDMRTQIYTDKDTGWKCLKHPLVFGVPYAEEMNGTYNLQYKYKVEALDKARRGCDWSSYLFLHERPYRFSAFMDVADLMDDKSYWEMLASIWSDSENLWQFRDELTPLLNSDRPEKGAMMDEDEREFLASLPDTICVYRGHQRINKMGHSWTMSYWKARWFAERFQSKETGILRGFVKKSSIIAVLTGRGEFEIIVDPDHVTGAKDFKLTKSAKLRGFFDIGKDSFALGSRSMHGPWHWDKVLFNALELARSTEGADKQVVELFAALHDCKRQNESDDPQHGPLAAEYVRELRSNGVIKLTNKQFDKLEYAIRHHDNGTISNDPTIGACWDADRLDLSRVGMVPNPSLLSTEAGKQNIWII
jgi:hypothetical protein